MAASCKLKFLMVFVWLVFAVIGSQSVVFCATDAPKTHGMSDLTDDEIISIDTLRQKQLNGEHFLLIDARGKKSYETSHIVGAVLSLTDDYYKQEELFRQGIISNMPNTDLSLSEAMGRYPKNTSIVTYCNNNCQASAVLLLKLKKLGYSDVKAMEEGFQSWEKKKYPVEAGQQKTGAHSSAG